MAVDEWLRVPVGRDAAAWVTVRVERTILVVVHTVAGAGHLLDAIELVEPDHRIQVVFTQAPDVFHNGVAEFLWGLGAVVIPWHQAVRSEFDLALATDCAEIHLLPTPVLLLAHGVMNNKLAPAALGGPASGLVVGLASPWLTWYGRLVPTMVGLSHVDLRKVLGRQCPQALPVARVLGDLCLDRLVSSRQCRLRYRRAFATGETRTLVTVSSTWGPHSTFATSAALIGALVAQLPPARYTVVAALHPALWYGHGPRQVMAWLRGQRRRGLRVVDPLGWRAAMAAADVVIGDHGSATVYAAAAGVPVVRISTPAAGSVAGRSAVGELATIAPALVPDRPLVRQLDGAVRAFQGGAGAAIAERITSRPGRAAALLRRQVYRLLRLTEPDTPARATPVQTVRSIEG